MSFRGAIADLSPIGTRVVIDQYLRIKSVDGDTYHAGIQFVDVQEEDRKRLINFLEIERQRLTNG